MDCGNGHISTPRVQTMTMTLDEPKYKVTELPQNHTTPKIMGPMQWRMTGCSTSFFQECPKHAYGVVTVRLERQDLNSPCFRKSHTLW